jgi:hypothetical protein
MPSQEDINALVDRIGIYRANLQIYLQQLAIHGAGNAPVAVFHGIHECRQNIKAIKENLRAWGVHIDSHPDDEGLEQEGKAPVASSNVQPIVLTPDQSSEQITVNQEVKEDTVSPPTSSKTPDATKICPTCGGKKVTGGEKIFIFFGPKIPTKPCSLCKGTGLVPNSMCVRCYGKGRILNPTYGAVIGDTEYIGCYSCGGTGISY